MSLLLSNPPAIIFINNDLTTQVQSVLVRQLRIDEVIDGYTFDQRILANPSWASDIKNIHNQRVLVKRPFTEMSNRNLADVAAFVKNGLITIEKNNFGPPINSYPVQKIHWGQLCVFVKKKGPGNIANSCCSCGVNITCTIRQELDALNRRICSSCGCCGGCCSCCVPTFKTLLVPHIPKTPGLKGI